MGLWHGTHFRHAMYGVLLGAGVALPQLWKILVQKSKLGPYPMPSLLGRAFTMSYFSAALFLIRPDFNEIRAHMPTLGGEADLETAVIYVVAWLLVLIAYDALALVRDYARENWERLGFARAPLISIGAAAAIYFLFLYGAFLKGSAVTLLYAAF